LIAPLGSEGQVYSAELERYRRAILPYVGPEIAKEELSIPPPPASAR
jgi:hypothetical protein